MFRLSLPRGASCAVTRLFEEQENVLKDIIAVDDDLVVRLCLGPDQLLAYRPPQGGIVVRSYFDCQEIDAGLAPKTGCFYVAGDLRGFAQRKLAVSNSVLARISISRLDRRNPSTREIERVGRVLHFHRERQTANRIQAYQLHLWSLEIHEDGFLPSRLGPSYVCDVNGTIGCSTCSK